MTLWLKKLGKNVSDLANWVGNHLGAVLTIFSLAVGILFVRERNKRISLQTDLELDDKEDKVKAAKQEVDNAKTEANNAINDFNAADAEYQRSKRK